MSTSLFSNPKRILITGATGFIGGHLVRAARAAGFEVWIAVRAATDPKKAKSLGVECIAIDYADEEAMLAEMLRLDVPSGEPIWHYVVHNAGITKARHRGEFDEVNAEHTRRLCRALQRAGGVERFVLMSSLSTYGKAIGDRPIAVGDEQRPHTAYGASKLLAERYVAQSGLPYTILLPTGVYGPGDKDYLMAIRSIAGGLNFMSGLSPQQLTFVYGEDLARAAMHVLSLETTQGQSYIISDGVTYTDEEFARLTQRLLGRKRCVHLRAPLWLLWCICQLGSLWTSLTGRTTPLNRDKYPILSQRSWRCDASPLFALGFEPRYTLEEGVRQTIDAARCEGLL